MADTTRSHSNMLLWRVRELFEQGNYAAVCRMEGEIDKWQCAPKLQRTYADVIFILASAVSISRLHDKAIRYLKIAYRLQLSFASNLTVHRQTQLQKAMKLQGHKYSWLRYAAALHVDIQMWQHSKRRNRCFSSA